MINCAFENGNKATLRHGVVDAIVTKDSQILLVKRTAKLLEGGKWALPGGFVDRGETVAQAAAREVHEETGWNITDIYPLMINSNPNRPGEDRQNISFLFACTATEKTGESDWESDEVKWFPLSALPPAEDLAFDHADYITFYRKTQSETVPLPQLI